MDRESGVSGERSIGREEYRESGVSGERSIGRAEYRESGVSGERSIGREEYREGGVSGERNCQPRISWLPEGRATDHMQSASTRIDKDGHDDGGWSVATVHHWHG